VKVTLRINKWLYPNANSAAATGEGLAVSVPDGTSVLEMVDSLEREEPVLWKLLFDEKTHMIHQNILVVLNNRVVNPYDRSDTGLAEGDEVMFLPVFDGG
jgi:molybdopterin converting factor small subunit